MCSAFSFAAAAAAANPWFLPAFDQKMFIRPAPWMPKTTLASQKKDAWSSTLHVSSISAVAKVHPRSSAHRLRNAFTSSGLEMVRSAAALRSASVYSEGCLASGFGRTTWMTCAPGLSN